MLNPKIIDGAILNKSIPLNQVIEILERWDRLRLNGVCIPSSWSYIDPIRIKLELMNHNSDVDIIPVIGYPNGDTTISSKIAEIVDNYGFATTLDVVLNASYIRMNMYDMVRKEILEILMHAATHIRWIIETPILTKVEIENVVGIILDHNGDIKTATGTKGPTEVQDVKLIKSVVGNQRLIKVSGGISDKDKAHIMINAGASIIGTSNPEALLS